MLNITTPSRRVRLVYIAITVVLLPLFFMGGPDWTSGPLFKAAWNLGHILFFALLMLALQPQQRLSGWRLWLAVSAGVAVVGVAIEWLQGNVGRQSDWHDILRNLIGTWLVLAWMNRPGPDTRRAIARWCLRVTALVLLVVELNAVAEVAQRQYRIEHQLPTLYDFNASEPSHFWRGNVYQAQDYVQDDDFSLRIDLGTNFYTGAALDNLPEDWRGYDALQITLYNPDPSPLEMTLRVNDIVHDRSKNPYSDRYNTRLPLESGMNRFRIPLSEIRQAPKSRDMDMNEIRRLVIFTTGLKQPRQVYLLQLKLDKAA